MKVKIESEYDGAEVSEIYDEDITGWVDIKLQFELEDSKQKNVRKIFFVRTNIYVFSDSH